MAINSIAAISKYNRAIGKQGKLPWQISEDLTRFSEITKGHPVIMGRKTWNSLPEKFRPLPGRTNIVMSNDDDSPALGAIVVENFEQAITEANRSLGAEEIFIIGGGQIYTHTIHHVERLYLTVVDQVVEGADAFFPEYENDFKLIAEEKHDGFSFQTLERIERKR